MGQDSSSDSGSSDSSSSDNGGRTAWSSSSYNQDQSYSGRCATSQANSDARAEALSGFQDNPYDSLGRGLGVIVSQHLTDSYCNDVNNYSSSDRSDEAGYGQ